MHGLEDEPVVRSGIDFCGCDSKPQFEGHIKSGRRGRRPVQLNSREIVNLIAATANQIDDLVQTVASAGDFNGGARVEAEVNQA